VKKLLLNFLSFIGTKILFELGFGVLMKVVVLNVRFSMTLWNHLKRRYKTPIMNVLVEKYQTMSFS